MRLGISSTLIKTDFETTQQQCATLEKKKHAEKNAENIHHNVNLKPKTKSRKLN